MKFAPLRDNVLVEFTRVTDRLTPAGIVIPGREDDPAREAIVRAVGPGREREDGTLVPVAVKPGDHVWINAGPKDHPPIVDPDDGRIWVIVPEYSITAIITEPQKSLPDGTKIVSPHLPVPAVKDRHGRPIVGGRNGH